jgi:hypothetical protein
MKIKSLAAAGAAVALVAVGLGVTLHTGTAAADSGAAYVQSSNAYADSGNGSISKQFGSPVHAGDLLVAAASFDTGNTQDATPSDTVGSVWHEAKFVNDSSVKQGLDVFYAVAAADGTDSVKVSFGTAVTYRYIAVSEYSGVNQVDAIVSNLGTGPAVTSGGVNAGVGELSVGAVMDTTDRTTILPGSGFAARETAGKSLGIEDKLSTATTFPEAKWSFAASHRYAAVQVVFSQGAGAPPVTDPPTTNPPVTDPPVTTPPVTDPPVTTPPVTTPPVTTPPVTTPPVTTPPPTTNPPTPSAFPDQNTCPDKTKPCSNVGHDTGYEPTGVVLHSCSGNLAANTTYDSCNFSGDVSIGGPNVHITRSLINGQVNGGGEVDQPGLLIQDTTIDCGCGSSGNLSPPAIFGGNFTLNRDNIYNVGHGVQIPDDNVVVENSWIHGHCCDASDAHLDTIISNGGASNVTIENNNLDGGPSGALTAAVGMLPDFGNLNNWTFDHNLLNTVGSYCAYTGDVPAKPHDATNIHWTNNHFGKKYSSKCGIYGPVYPGGTSSGFVWSGNVWDDTGATIPSP